MDIPTSKLTKSQTKTIGPKKIEYYGGLAKMTVELRYDDNCNNGRNSFGITADIKTVGGRWLAGGCCHDEIAEHFPELEPLIQWHLMASDGPMHYVANSMYLAGDRDYNGHRKGEPNRWSKKLYFGDLPVAISVGSKADKIIELVEAGSDFDFEILRFDHSDHGKKNEYQYDPNYGFGGIHENWAQAPFDTEEEGLAMLTALQLFAPHVQTTVTGYSNGKEPDLDAGRRAANWPDAEPDDFTKEKLVARLPQLLTEFKAAMENLGFVY